MVLKSEAFTNVLGRGDEIPTTLQLQRDYSVLR